MIKPEKYLMIEVLMVEKRVLVGFIRQFVNRCHREKQWSSA